MRAEVPACCYAGVAVSLCATQHGTLELSTCVCCSHILVFNYVICFSLLHHVPPNFYFYPFVLISSYLLVCQIVFDMHFLVRKLMIYFLFHRACVHGQNTLQREIYWTHDWFGGKKYFTIFSLYYFFIWNVLCKKMHLFLTHTRQTFISTWCVF